MKHVSYSAPEMTDAEIEAERGWLSFMVRGRHNPDWFMHRLNCEAAARLGHPNAIKQLQAFENFKAFKRMTQ